jgi:hypothetical protein
MAKVNLTPEEKAHLIEAINKGVEPLPYLLPKLFGPSLSDGGQG